MGVRAARCMQSSRVTGWLMHVQFVCLADTLPSLIALDRTVLCCGNYVTISESNCRECPCRSCFLSSNKTVTYKCMLSSHANISMCLDGTTAQTMARSSTFFGGECPLNVHSVSLSPECSASTELHALPSVFTLLKVLTSFSMLNPTINLLLVLELYHPS